MCRWLAYSGGSIPLEDLLFRPQQNLIDQSLSSHSKETPTNGDGFGVGWYTDRPTPGLFRCVRPAWNDMNLRDLATHIESPLFLAHVRAASSTIIQETNCHPFRYKNWLFMHNGDILDYSKLRRDLLFAVAPGLFHYIEGTTDSEVMFYLALSLGLEEDPPGALERMVGLIESIGRSHGNKHSLWMTIAVTDGVSLYAVRYSSNGKSPTLYYSPEVDEIYKMNPKIRGSFGATARAVVSEPIGAFPQIWTPVPEATMLSIRNGDLVAQAFQPRQPE